MAVGAGDEDHSGRASGKSEKTRLNSTKHCWINYLRSLLRVLHPASPDWCETQRHWRARDDCGTLLIGLTTKG